MNLRSTFCRFVILWLLLPGIVAPMRLAAQSGFLPHRRKAFRGGVTPPLDVISGAYSAFSSARKLRSAYSGKCLRVRRASDDLQVDIGFSGNDIDSAAIGTHCSGTDGYVAKIYDQSGNAQDLANTGTTAQPLIYTNGAVLTGSNGKVCMRFDGTDDFLYRNSGTFSSTISYHVVFNAISNVSSNIIVSMGSTAKAVLRQGVSPTSLALNNGTTLAGPEYSTGTWYFTSAGFNTAGNDTIGLNGGTGTGGDAGNNSPTELGLSWYTTLGANVEISEWIVYNAAYSDTDASTLFNNADAFYGLP